MSGGNGFRPPKTFVSMGKGVAFVPRMCVQEELARQEFAAAPVSDLRIQRKLRLTYRRHASLSAAQGFLKVARAPVERPPLPGRKG